MISWRVLGDIHLFLAWKRHSLKFLYFTHKVNTLEEDLQSVISSLKFLYL